MFLDWLKFPGFKLPLPYLWQRARHEMPASVMLPTGSLVTEHDVKCSEGWYFRVLRLRKPVPFETAQPHVVLDLHETKAHLLATLNAEGEIALNEYQSQHFAYDRLDPVEGDGYAAELNDDYDAHLAASPFLMREHFIVIAFRLEQEGSRPRTADDFARIQAESVHVLDGLTQSALAMLQPFEPVLLGSYWRDGVRFSQVLEFLSLLVNGRTQPMRHTRAPLCALLPAVRVSGRDGLVELRSLNWVRYAAMLGIKEYIEEPECGLLDAALYVPVEWLDTIAGRFYDRRSALDALQRQYSHLLSAADRSESQIVELKLAMDDVQAGRYRMLQFFYNKAVFGDTPEQALAAAARVKGAISRATGLEMAQVDMIPDAAWWSQVPTNFWLQPREADLSSRVFAAMACTHGFASGKRDGNPWGQAVIILMTDSGQPFYLSLH
ncbi:hypothetical protein [Azohydromonas australica]|uniref:VirB4 family type IV secretion/conjugal transfer ATPase n=1 Tax=Azohydromonas australica TaxID=364039 RepID=UPI0004225C4F|nr:hypothetical protein [Azohydromonas australica]